MLQADQHRRTPHTWSIGALRRLSHVVWIAEGATPSCSLQALPVRSSGSPTRGGSCRRAEGRRSLPTLPRSNVCTKRTQRGALTGMSIPVTARLDESVVEALDRAVEAGLAPNRGAVVTRAVSECWTGMERMRPSNRIDTATRSPTPLEMSSSRSSPLSPLLHVSPTASVDLARGDLGCRHSGGRQTPGGDRHPRLCDSASVISGVRLGDQLLSWPRRRGRGRHRRGPRPIERSQLRPPSHSAETGADEAPRSAGAGQAGRAGQSSDGGTRPGVIAGPRAKSPTPLSVWSATGTLLRHRLR